jgi:hypothetical protein
MSCRQRPPHIVHVRKFSDDGAGVRLCLTSASPNRHSAASTSQLPAIALCSECPAGDLCSSAADGRSLAAHSFDVGHQTRLSATTMISQRVRMSALREARKC